MMTRISAAQLIPENIFLHKLDGDPSICQVEVDPIDFCNHACSWCFTKNFREDKRLNLYALKEYLDYFSLRGGKSVLFSGGGEPLLYKGIYKNNATFDGESILSYLANRSIWVGLITNGLLLCKLWENRLDISNMSFIRVSLDAVSGLSHAERHVTQETDFNIVIENIAKLIAIRGDIVTPAIGISFVVDSFNDINYLQEEIKQINELSKSLSVDFVQFKHIHTNKKKSAQNAMHEVHKLCNSLYWDDVEFWVQKYESAKSDIPCKITQYIQSIGNDTKRFPCCHHFGRSDFLDQTKFIPEGKIINNCDSPVCRYTEINNLLSSINKTSTQNHINVLKKSLDLDGFHPYRLCPTSPTIYTPFHSRVNN